MYKITVTTTKSDPNVPHFFEMYPVEIQQYSDQRAAAPGFVKVEYETPSDTVHIAHIYWQTEELYQNFVAKGQNSLRLSLMDQYMVDYGIDKQVAFETIPDA